MLPLHEAQKQRAPPLQSGPGSARFYSYHVFEFCGILKLDESTADHILIYCKTKGKTIDTLLQFLRWFRVFWHPEARQMNNRSSRHYHSTVTVTTRYIPGRIQEEGTTPGTLLYFLCFRVLRHSEARPINSRPSQTGMAFGTML